MNFRSQKPFFKHLHWLTESSRLARLEREVRRVRFIAGIALIAISFAVYPAYPIVILFLPSSVRVKFGVIVALSFLSWGAFSAGILLAGLEGYKWLKELWKRKTGDAVGGKSRTEMESQSNRDDA